MSASAEMPVRVRVLRLDPGESATVFCLTDGIGPEMNRVGGTFGHYFKGAWQPCIPEICPAAAHSQPRFWRGYVAAFRQDKASKCWVPCVLEVSESLELDMRGRYAAHQLWDISRAKASGKRKPPYVGRLHPRQGFLERTLCFDIRPVLEHFYHLTGLNLKQPSDQPDRVYLATKPMLDSHGSGNGNGEAKPATAAQVDELKRRMAGIANGKGGAA